MRTIVAAVTAVASSLLLTPLALVASAQAGAGAITLVGGEGDGGGHMGGKGGAHRGGAGFHSDHGHFKHPRFVNNRVFFVAGVPWWGGYNDPCWWWNPQWGWVWSCDSSGDDGD